MENIHFKSDVAYTPFRERLFKHTSVRLLFVVLGLQAVGVLMLAVAFEQPYIILVAFFLGVVFYVNYFFFAKWVQYYIEEIMLDIQQKTCSIKYYDKDTSKKEQIPFKNLDIKLEVMHLKGTTKYKLCFYKEKKKIISQFCGIGYWSKEVCEKVLEAYTLLK